MTILYDVVDIKTLESIDIINKVKLISEIIIIGKIHYYNKFIVLLEKNISNYISATEMLKLLPMDIDVELLEMILNSYKFEQGMHFFFNYAINNDNTAVREIIYDYFIDNYSHVMIDNMGLYSQLLDQTKCIMH